MFVDNRNSVPLDNRNMIHQYRMDNEPRYAGQVEFDKRTSNQALEPSMIDPTMFILGPTNSALKAGGRAVDDFANIPMVQGRRDALKTGGIVAGGAALGTQPIVQAVKMFGDDAAKATSKKGATIMQMQSRANKLKMIADKTDDLDLFTRAHRIAKKQENKIGNIVSPSVTTKTATPKELTEWLSWAKQAKGTQKPKAFQIQEVEAELYNLARTGKNNQTTWNEFMKKEYGR